MMEHAELARQLRDVDLFLLREYQIMKAIADRCLLDEVETAEIRIRLNALAPQRERLKSCIGRIEKGELSESRPEIGIELELVRQFLEIELRYARKGMPAILNPDDKRVSDYVANLAKIMKGYDIVVYPLNQN